MNNDIKKNLFRKSIFHLCACMFTLIIKYELRKGVLFSPLLIAYIFALVIFLADKNTALIVPFLLQTDYYKPNGRNIIGIRLVRITDFNLSKLLLLTNTSFLLWLFLGYVLGRVSSLIFSTHTAMQETLWLLEFFQVNLMAFIVGNTIANSDLFTIKNCFWKTVSPPFAFNLMLMFGLGFIKLLSLSSYYLPLLALTLAVTSFAWYRDTNTYRRFEHFRHFLA